ncbi:MAG TPA: hypothetical protein VM536_15040, partial [Chloroflexia bacterium]|nr:hypothetical protein [Chloroflexia bacterium]
TLHSTALYALAELVDGEGLLLRCLFHDPRDPTLAAQPCLDRVAPEGSDPSTMLAAGVSEAHYAAASRTLTLGLSALGAEPTGETRVVLECARVPAVHQVRQDGVAVASWRHAAETGALHIPVTVRTVTRLEVQLA